MNPTIKFIPDNFQLENSDSVRICTTKTLRYSNSSRRAARQSQQIGNANPGSTIAIMAASLIQIRMGIRLLHGEYRWESAVSANDDIRPTCINQAATANNNVAIVVKIILEIRVVGLSQRLYAENKLVTIETQKFNKRNLP